MNLCKESTDADLYNALIERDAETVLSLCEILEDGPLHEVTIHKDTVLHVALYSQQVQLAESLIEILSTNPRLKELLAKPNSVGNNVLHEAATYNRLLPAAKMLLALQPRKLLSATNNNNETALFRAARYGKGKTFKFFEEKLVDTFGVEEAKKCHRIDGSSTTLHASIASEHFVLALWIAKRHQYLLDVKDVEGMTALQHLANNPSAFEFRGEGWLMTLIDSHAQIGEDEDGSTFVPDAVLRVPWWDQMVQKRKKYNAAVALAKILVQNDMSWKITQVVAYGDAKIPENRIPEKLKTPLFVATRTACYEIVDEILNVYPQAVEHIDEDGRNILHIAIKYRQMEIFKMVQKMNVPMRRLVRKCDLWGNSILHMVGKKATNDNVEQNEKRSPSFQLQEDLLLFEYISKVIKAHFYKHINVEGRTAEELFAQEKEGLRVRSEEWLKRTAENCSIVAVLIATVAFAAAYTVPGGSNPENGAPVLIKQTFFVIFTISDVLSLTFCLTAVVIFLSILTSSFRLLDFKRSLPQKLMLGITCLIMSVSMMMMAFAATVILMIRNNGQWTRVALHLVAFLPVTVFASIYLPLYISLMGTFKYTIMKLGSYFPRLITRRRVTNQSSDQKAKLNVEDIDTSKRSPRIESSSNLV